MSNVQRCLVIVPADAPELYARLVATFIDNPRVFVSRALGELRDRHNK